MENNINSKFNSYMNKILNILIVVAIFVTLGIIIHKVLGANIGADKYEMGLNLYNKKDYSNAYYNFSRIPKTSKYYNISLFRQGMCAEQLADRNTQAKKYEIYANHTQNSLTAEAAFKSGVAYFDNKKYANAQKMFKQALKAQLAADKKISDYSIAANYYLGEILKYQKTKEALSYYIKYIKTVYDGKYSLKSANRIDELLSKNSSIILQEEDNFYVGRVFYYAKDYKKAQKYFDLSNDKYSWYLRAENYLNLGNKEQARLTLTIGLFNYYSNVETQDLSTAINTFVNINSDNKQANWQQLYDFFKDKDISVKDEIYYNLGLHKEMFQENIQGDYAIKSLSDLFFDAYKNKSYNLVRSFGHIFIESFPNSQIAPKVLYYLAKNYENIYKKTEAQQLYNRLLVNYPDTFWAFRAYTKVKNKKSTLAKFENLGYLKIEWREIEPDFPYDEIVVNKNDANLLNKLIEIKDYDLIEKISPDNKAVRSWTNYKLGNTALSVVLARDYLNELKIKPDFQDDLYLLAYPILYKKEINRNCELYNLNGFLISSLIREESYFNTKAKSDAGALGLMQLMPQTASFIMQRDVSKDELFNPEYNIDVGTRYYSHIKRTLNNNNVYAVLAYNGGPNAVQRWIEKNQNNNIDEFIDNIPFDETQNYILKVYRTYWNYLNIYKSEKL